MEIRHIFFIINPSAGKEEPIIELIGKCFHNSSLEVTIHVLEDNEDPAAVVREVIGAADLIAVYGGDGSITATATALIGTGKPLAIIPGGTANVLSKELDIPQDSADALVLIREGRYTFKKIDTGLVNGVPFLLRVNLGIMAQMITETDPGLKDKIGQLAYGVAAIKSANDSEPADYQLIVDGEQLAASGVALTITNSGNMGIGSLQLTQGISISDGLLDIVLLRDAGIVSILKAAGGSVFGKETDAVSHWTGKEIKVTLPEKQVYLCDDCKSEADELIIRIVPLSLTILTPLSN